MGMIFAELVQECRELFEGKEKQPESMKSLFARSPEGHLRLSRMAAQDSKAANKSHDSTDHKAARSMHDTAYGSHEDQLRYTSGRKRDYHQKMMDYHARMSDEHRRREK